MISSVPVKFDQQKLNEIAPKVNVIMSVNTPQQKLVDKHEVNLFDKLFKAMKYKYEDIIKVLKLYSEVN